MRKADMVSLARLWGYKSDVWQSRQPRRRKTPPGASDALARAASASVEPLAAAPPPPAAGAAAAALATLFCERGAANAAERVRASAPAARAALGGAAARAALLAAPPELRSAMGGAAAAAAARADGTALRAVEAALRTARTRVMSAASPASADDAPADDALLPLLQAPGGAGTEAWEAGDGVVDGVSAAFGVLVTLLGRAAARAASWAAHAVGVAPPALALAAAAAGDEARGALRAAAGSAARQRALLAAFATAPVAVHARTAEAALAAAAELAGALAAGCSDRADWQASLGGVTEEGRSAGLRSSAGGLARELPPLLLFADGSAAT
jgi:hypothetical protein